MVSVWLNGGYNLEEVSCLVKLALSLRKISKVQEDSPVHLLRNPEALDQLQRLDGDLLERDVGFFLLLDLVL